MARDDTWSAPVWRRSVEAPPFGGSMKRAFDLAVAVPATIFFLPLLVLLALLVKIQDGGPVFFVQPRVGRRGRLFPCLKFRSMVVRAEDYMQALLREDPEAAREWREKQKLANDPRITPVGRVLRVTSADELPQLINVLRGDMSIVGPRPILPEQTEQYGSAFGRYCTARPGMTGLWQVSERSESAFRRRPELDQIYLRAWSLPTDLVLLVRTVDVVLRQRGAC
jgi:lipopolysaccharide/colanic/teichoic acid biosynthesis glycosyltransferase